jgi:hypothetical protein
MGGVEGWVDGRMGGWVGLRVGFNNINDMYNNDVGKGGAQGCEAYEVKKRVALVRAPFYFINLLPTSLLYISILLSSGRSGNRTSWNAWMTKEDSSLKRQRSLITYGVHRRRLANDPRQWLKQPSLSRDDLRYHVVVHASHREQRWEPPSACTASMIERDPEVIPDVDIAAKVGKDLFLDEKIPRHESGQEYVRVV